LKKINVVLLSIFLVGISIIGTFYVTTFIEIDLGDKVVISKESMDNYQELYAAYSEVDELKEYVEVNYYKDISEELLYEGMKKGLFEILDDPYSIYMGNDEFTSYMESSSGEYPGIGIYLAPNDDNQIEIVAPIEDTPADRAGLIAKDLIVAVNGDPVNADMMDDAITMIKGEPGTSVTITIDRPSKEENFDVEIVREWIDVKVVKTRMLSDDMGYLRLSMFDENSASEFKSHMDDLIDQGATKVVIDLRQNPGGYLDQCVEIADSLLGKGLIVYTDSRNGDHESFESDAKKYNVELAVLVDEGSASASEILTGALKDHQAATIIGVQTFGKGVVQIVRPYTEKTGFKLTTSEYFTPNGENIHGVGITPDIIEPLDESFYEIEKPSDEDDNQLQKAIEVLNQE
jgi:carboxyl-terminal processing protease